jgi:histone H3/H4
MTSPLVLTDAQYRALKLKLHQAHDKLIKLTLGDVEAMRELLVKIILPLLPNVTIDLNDLTLDNTAYIRPNLQVFFSDVVYLTTIIDEESGMRETLKMACLVEHKSEMPSELELRLQATDYINAIMKKNYDKATDKTIGVIPIVFNQFDKDWEKKTFRSLFPQLSPKIARFILEFDYLVINLASLSEEIMASLDEFGTLKASLLAMRYVKNKQFLKKHFTEIFLFLQQHPEKIDLRDQLITYLLGQSDIDAKELQELLNNIFSPTIIKEMVYTGNGFIAVAYREAAAETEALVTAKLTAKFEKKTQLLIKKATIQAKKMVKQAAQQAAQQAVQQAAQQAVENAAQLAVQQAYSTYLTVMRSWYKGLDINAIADIVDLSTKQLKPLITSFEIVKKTYKNEPNIDFDGLKLSSKLEEKQLKVLLELLQRS